MEILYLDDALAVCVKPAGVLSTDEPGGMPSLVREALGDPDACVRTVHRLDRVVGGLMALARSPEAASRLSEQVRDRRFGKEYLAVVHGAPEADQGTFSDLLLRSREERKTYVTDRPQKGAQEAVLDYRVLGRGAAFTLVSVALRTGRTHQIRCQFAARGLPLAGDRKYGVGTDACPIALWSSRLCFFHPFTGERLAFQKTPPEQPPWTDFSGALLLWDGKTAAPS